MIVSLAGPSTFGMNAGWLEQTCCQSIAGGRHWMPPAKKKVKVRYHRWTARVEWGGEEGWSRGGIKYSSSIFLPSPTSSGTMQKDRDSPC